MKIIKLFLYLFLGITSIVILIHCIQFFSLLNSSNFKIADAGASPKAWFIVQFCIRTLFLIVGFIILKLIRKYEEIGFYDLKTLQLFDYIAIACIMMAFLEAGLFSYNIYLGLQSKIVALKDVIPQERGIFCPKFDQKSILEMTIIRFIFKLFIGDNPQTMYFMIALVFLAIKEFVKKALLIHTENQAFI